MTSLTVACVWVRGNVDYGMEYVTRLNAMASRFISQPFHFVCLTDRVAELPKTIPAIQIPTPKGMFGWWSKIHVFNSEHGFTGRMLYLDLDTLILSALDDVINFPAPFALIPHAGSFNGKNGLQVVKRFNSSVMVWDAGTQDHIYRNFTSKTPKRLWGDQDHIGEQCPFAATMNLDWFPRISAFLDGSMPSKDAKIVLVKTLKNIEAAKRLPWVEQAWA
jgi:hypothetical protein